VNLLVDSFGTDALDHMCIVYTRGGVISRDRARVGSRCPDRTCVVGSVEWDWRPGTTPYPIAAQQVALLVRTRSNIQLCACLVAYIWRSPAPSVPNPSAAAHG
jgi:hypothetical protein